MLVRIRKFWLIVVLFKFQWNIRRRKTPTGTGLRRKADVRKSGIIDPGCFYPIRWHDD